MEKYQLQLEQVTASLAKDPQNGTLLALKSKLEQLLALQSSTQTASKSSTPSTSTPPLQVGEVCEVFVKELSTWKPARVLSALPKEDVYIVELELDKTTRRLERKNVRRPQEKAPKNKKPATATNALVQKPATGAVRRKQQQQKPELAGVVQWKKFSQKLNKK